MAPFAARMVNNLDWTAEFDAIGFLRDVGKHFRMGRMLAKETVSARLNSDEGLSFTEFSYQILQGMDYLELYRRYGCTLQTGGSDQWGNLTSGTELIRKVEGRAVHALATPLITKADGTKFGKTEGGAVWLDPAMTSPYAFYQFWFNTDDRDIAGYLKVFSLRPLDELAELEAAVADRPHAREAQRALAGELTALVHGEQARDAAVLASAALFGRGELGAIDEATLHAALAEAGLIESAGAELTVVDLLKETGLTSSLSEGAAGGGLRWSQHQQRQSGRPRTCPIGSGPSAREVPCPAPGQAVGRGCPRAAVTSGSGIAHPGRAKRLWLSGPGAPFPDEVSAVRGTGIGSWIDRQPPRPTRRTHRGTRSACRSGCSGRWWRPRCLRSLRR